MGTSPAEDEPGGTRPSCFGSHTINGSPFHGGLRATFVPLLCFLMTVPLVKMPPTIGLQCCLFAQAQGRPHPVPYPEVGAAENLH